MASKATVSNRIQPFLAVLESIREMVMDSECLQESDVALLERTKNDIVVSAVDILQRTRNEIAARKRHLLAAKSDLLAAKSVAENAAGGPSNKCEAEEETELPRKTKKNRQNTKKKNENYEVAVELLKWILIFTRSSESESTFLNAFLRKGFAGYGAFRYEIRNITRIVCKHLYPHDDDLAQAMLDRFEKRGGWLDSFVMDMKTYIWESLKPRVPTEKWTEMVSPQAEAHTISLFLEWSKLLNICRKTGR